MSDHVEVRTLAPTTVCVWCGFRMMIERQARRTTFLRALDEPFDGVRIQLKHRALVDLAGGASRETTR